MKVVILGAGGMLGHKVYWTLKKNFEIFAVARSAYKDYESLKIFEPKNFLGGVDLLNPNDREAVLNKIRPEWIINCVGITTRKIPADRSAVVIATNSLLPHALSEWAIDHGAKLIHFSTDCVFSGDRGQYSIADTPDARDLYGLSKRLGEVTQSRSTLTIRSSIIGREIKHKTELIEWLISQRGRSAKGFTEVFYSGVTTNYMAKVVQAVLLSPTPLFGLKHISSPRISKFELLSHINKALDLGVDLSQDASKRSDKSLIGNELIDSLKNVDKPSWENMISELALESEFYRRGTS